MESLSIGLSVSHPQLIPVKTQYFLSKSVFPLSNFSPHSCKSSSQSRSYCSRGIDYLEIPNVESRIRVSTQFHCNSLFLKPHLSFLSMGFIFPFSSFAAEISAVASDEVSTKINLEAVLVSIDEFFNRNPFFVAGLTFVWLVLVPFIQEYFRKYKFISAIDAFRKLRDDPDCQLIDIRDRKSLAFLNSANLKTLNKSVLQVEFREGEEDGFVKQVLDNLEQPENTILCILDNFDGNSMKVAELLVGNGIKEAYAIKGGIRGKKGWQEIQGTLLPPSVHIYPEKAVKVSRGFKSDGVDRQRREKSSNSSASVTGPSSSRTENSNNGSLKRSDTPASERKCGPRSSSPYPNYPDLKPPSSPTPSKPDC